MLNIIFINEKEYKDTLIGKELLHLLDKSVLLNSNWGCFSRHFDEINLNIALDNLVYCLNNFLSSKKFENIIIGWSFDNVEFINQLISHLDCSEAQITIFNLTDTTVNNIDNFELLNKEYKKDYYTIQHTGQLVKNSFVDTTDCSAFKSAHILSQIIYQ